MHNHQIILDKLPQGKLTADCFQMRQTPTPRPGSGDVLLRTLYIPLDAASRAWMQGFLLSDFLHKREQALAALTAWVAAKKLTVLEDLIAGFEQLPAALVGLLAGKNIGKRIVQVA